MKIGGIDILLPTMMVGNYPKPRWYMGHSFGTVPKGDFLPDAISFEAFEDCMAAMVHDQEEAGLDVISDARLLGGDSPYASIIGYFVDRIEGFSMSGPALGLPTYSTLHAPSVVGPLSRKAPFLLNQLRAVKKFTDKPVKIQYPGLHPMVMAARNTYYPDVKDMAFALAKVYNEELREIADNGADIIQFDEFTWHFGLSFGDWEIDVFNEAVDGVDAEIVAHACWGNYLGTSGYLPDGPMHGEAPDKEGTTYVLSLRSDEAGTRRSAALFPRVEKLNLHALNFEMACRGPEDLEPLRKNDWTKPFIAGVIDVKSVSVETATQVAERIRSCLEYVDASRLGLSTDCGLINLPRIVAQAKLRALVEGARIVRAELESSAESATNIESVPA